MTRRNIKKKNTKGIINAKKIHNRIFSHKTYEGGCFSLVTGGMGSGKTSLLLYMVERMLFKYPEQLVFFSNPYFSPVQSLRLGLEANNIMVKTNTGVTFYDRNKSGRDITNNLSITYFESYEDVWRKAKRGKCNSVFFGDRNEWCNFIKYLRRKNTWKSIFIDEISEIAEANKSGSAWNDIGSLAKQLKESRKCMMDVHSNTQAVSDIDYRVKSKVMVKIFLPGAKADGGPVNQGAINGLKLNRKIGNEAWLQQGGEFGKMRFPNKYEPKNDYNIEVRNNE